MLKIALPPGWSGFINGIQNMNSNYLIIMWAGTYIFPYALGSPLWLKLYLLRCTRCKLTVVTGPLVPPETLSHHSEWKVKVHYIVYVWTTRENRMENCSYPIGNVISIGNVKPTTIRGKEVIYIIVHFNISDTRCYKFHRKLPQFYTKSCSFNTYMT